MQIRINKVECGHCNEMFCELEDCEFDACPYCEELFGFDDKAYVVGTEIAELEIDYQTGELRFAGNVKDPALPR